MQRYSQRLGGRLISHQFVHAPDAAEAVNVGRFGRDAAGLRQEVLRKFSLLGQHSLCLVEKPFV